MFGILYPNGPHRYASVGINPCGAVVNANALRLPVVVSLGNGIFSIYYTQTQTHTVTTTTAPTVYASVGFNPCGAVVTANALGLPVVVSLGNGLCSIYYNQTTTAPVVYASVGINPCNAVVTANALGIPIVVSLGNGLCSVYYTSSTQTQDANNAGEQSCDSIRFRWNQPLQRCHYSYALGIPVIVSLGNGLYSVYYTPSTQTQTTQATPATDTALATQTTQKTPATQEDARILYASIGINPCAAVVTANVLGIPVVVSLGNGLCSVYYTSTTNTVLGLPTVSTSITFTLSGGASINISPSLSKLSLSAPSVPVVSVPSIAATTSTGSCGIGASINALGIPIVIDLGNGVRSTYYTSSVSSVTVTQITIISLSTSGSSPGSNLATTTTGAGQILGDGVNIGSCGASVSVGLFGFPIVISLSGGQCSYVYTITPTSSIASSTVSSTISITSTITTSTVTTSLMSSNSSSSSRSSSTSATGNSQGFLNSVLSVVL
jgi:hypothetical protein